MPLQNGEMHPRFFGMDPRAQLADKIAQMRSDLMHIQNGLHLIERRVRSNATGKDMRAEFSNLHNWYLSAVESYYAMVWAAFDHMKVNEVIRDFENKFKHFTSIRSISPASRPR